MGTCRSSHRTRGSTATVTSMAVPAETTRMRYPTRALSAALALSAAVTLTGCRDQQPTPKPVTPTHSATTASTSSPSAPASTAPPSTAPAAGKGWTVPGATALTPVLAGTTLLAGRVTGTKTTLLGVNLTDGTTRWTADLIGAPAPEDADHAAHTIKVVATPDRVYAAWPTPHAEGVGDADWTVTAFETATGRTVWTRPNVPGAPLYATANGLAIGTGFAASDAEVAEPTGTALLDGAKGTTTWTLDGTAPLGGTDDAVLVNSGTSPAGLSAVDAESGTTVWTITEESRNLFAEAVAADRVLVTLRDDAGYASVARVLDAASGQQVGKDVALPAEADFTAHVDRDAAVALIGTGTTVQAIDLATGTVLWSQPASADPVSVAGAGLAWLPAAGQVLDSRTGHPVDGVPADGVNVAGNGLAFTVEHDLHATVLPPSHD